jgi:transcription elongation factor GreA-like protein/transcription elongation GreA/GreB family factor
MLNMSYLKEFLRHIEDNDIKELRGLWEEYCICDIIEGEELKSILQAIKESSLAKPFGSDVELIVPLWETISDEAISYDIAKLIFDIETTNTAALAALAYNILKKRYGDHKYFNEKIRLIGLRHKKDFQSSLSNYELLTHMDENKFVYHTGGWGVGEVIELSLMREQFTIEFENVVGRKDVAFKTAFKSLIPIPKEHFLSQRFGFPDDLEEEARKDPSKVIRMLLSDLGPKTAVDIKEELYELVIPAGDWTKWWQVARSKIKKDTMIETPKSVRGCFKIRSTELLHEERCKESVAKAKNNKELIAICYNFMRDFPEVLKDEKTSQVIEKALEEIVSDDKADIVAELQARLLLKEFFRDEKRDNELVDSVVGIKDVASVIQDIEVSALKKRILVIIRKNCDDWKERFLDILFSFKQSALKDYAFGELAAEEDITALREKIMTLLDHSIENPRAFVWYFQKVINKEDRLFDDEDLQKKFFERFLMVLNEAEKGQEYKDLVKKMYSIITAKRYIVVREALAGADIEYLHEILLLVTKCRSFSEHDIKILRSLAEVANPDIKKEGSGNDEVDDVMWATQEGFNAMQKRIEHIATVETVSNAREIEAARALGDLRENAEYKFALEKRRRLQGELKTLTQQLNKARVLTADDVASDRIDIGTKVDLEDSQGKKITYTILGPWEADPDKGVLSYRSRFAEEMIGNKEGETFRFKDEIYNIVSVKNIFEE